MKIIKFNGYSRNINGFRQAPRRGAGEEIQGDGALKSDAPASTRKTEGGFTLAEIMVGCALLAVMVISLYGGISYGFTAITLSRQNLRATQIALEKMEIVRMYSWEQVNSNGFVPVTFTAPYFPSFGGGNTNGGLVYYGTTLITNVNLNPSYNVDMRQILVTLNWTNRNAPQSLQMSTYISQYGMQRYIY